jgi:Lipocalin-like domain
MNGAVVAGRFEIAHLVGTWRLRTWISEAADGIEHPFGEEPQGILVYTSGGTMITTIGRAGRPPIDGRDVLAGPAGQRLDAMATFIAYSGRFRIDGADVVHDVTMSLYPNWIGTTQRRHVALSANGSTLTLSADPFLAGGRLGTHRLTWERVDG